MTKRSRLDWSPSAGVSDFKPLRDDEIESADERTATLSAELDHPADAFKIVGQWYSKAELERQSGGGTLGPKFTSTSKDGTERNGVVLGPMKGDAPRSHVLTLTCEPIDRISTESPSFLLMMAGLDPPSTPKESRSFLALAYPILNASKLRERLGTIDIERDQGSGR